MASEQPEDPRSDRFDWLTPVTLVLVVVLGLWAFQDVGDFDFVQYDDPALIVNNPYVNRGLTADSIAWAFTFAESDDLRAEPFARELWAPLSFISLAADVQFAGLNPAVHHRVNLILHLISTCLAFLFFRRLTGSPLAAGIVAAVFCLHPMHVESVAWISERKDVLSAMFVLATLNLYLSWKRCGETSPGWRRPALWWAAIICFALACLAKPMAVITPLLLVWIDAWLDQTRSRANGREPEAQDLIRQVKEKLPFVIIMLLAAVTTFGMKLAHAAAPTGAGSHLWGRLLEIPFALLYYLQRTFWPYDLFPQYERYPHEFLYGTFAGVVVIAVISWGSWFLRRRAPEFWFGWGWFIICLLPVIGFAYAGPSFTADRYTYLAHCGLAFAVGVSIARLAKRHVASMIPALAACLLFLYWLAPLARSTSQNWRSSEPLFRHGVRVQGYSAKNWNNLGALLVAKGDIQGGVACLRRSIELGTVPDAHYNLASTYIAHGLGSPELTKGLLLQCIHLDPDNFAAMETLGKLLNEPQLEGIYDPEASRKWSERAAELQSR